MTKKFLYLLMIVGLFFSSFCFATEPVFITAIVLKISDGDTIWVVDNNGRRLKLRLLGIDTPEKYASHKLDRDAIKCGVSKSYMRSLGMSATQYAKSLLHRGQTVRVALYGRGYYGRSLAMVYLPDGSCYNEDVVRDGYACLYTYRGHKSKQIPAQEWQVLQRLIKAAEESRTGLWGEHFDLMECLCRR